MGGQINHYRDFEFMKQYQILQSQFIKKSKVFHTSLIKFPLSTSNMAIVDMNGRRVKLAGGNWSGGHASRHCVGGLDRKPLQALIKDIKNLFGMNCVRITFSLQSFRRQKGEGKYVNPQFLSANKYLLGKTVEQIFIHTVDQLTKAGLMVILNNHTSKSQWCCSNNDGDGLWFNKDYPQNQFFECLERLAQIFRNNYRVIGFDLRNEIRPSYMGKPTWGDGSKFDWKKAVQTIANRIHAKSSHYLIIVGGLNYQLDLRPALQKPIVLQKKNKLVYSGHFFGFSWGPSLMWSSFSEQWFRQKIFSEQLFIRGVKGEGVPFILGQFGDNDRSIPWKYLLRFIKELDLDWIYWCLDGYKCDKQEDETYGIWDWQFKGARNPQILQDLKKIGYEQNYMSS